jgi:hypothetical protein
LAVILETTCPYCGHRQDAHTFVGNGEAEPHPGDASVCLYCAEVAIYDDEGLRFPKLSELLVLKFDRNIKQAVETVREFHRARGDGS